MEQIRSLSAVLDHAMKIGPATISVAAAEDLEVLEAVEDARSKGVANAILVGDPAKIKEIGAKVPGFSPSNYEIVEELGGEAASSLKAVEFVSGGKADILMKGMVQTSNFLRAVLNKEKGLRTGSTLSHAYIHEIDKDGKYDRLIFFTDPAFNIAPDLKAKIAIINNVVSIAHQFGIEKPKVACLAAVEVVNPDMPATLDAAALAQMSRRGQFKGCVVDGPFAIDNAISEESAKHKGIVSEVAGHADVLVAPNIEAANIASKSVIYFSHNKTAALVLGARCPVILTSRADSPETKLLSIACAVTVSKKHK